MLTLEAYLMGRDKQYPEEYTLDIKTNAEALVLRVNNLLKDLNWGEVKVTSGWRPLAVNLKSSGAKRSLHMVGQAVDLGDADGSLKKAILDKPYLLLDYGLWLENPKNCPGWAHLDSGIRPSRLIRVFNP